MGRQHFGGDLTGKWLFTGGLGGMGGAQPLAAVMAGASCLAVECRKSSIDMRLRTGYLDTWTDNLDEALRLIDESCKAGTPKSVGLLGNVADVLAELLKRGVKPDLLTDQTSAHDPVNGYLPQGWTVEQWDEKRVSAPKEVEKAARASMANHIRAMLGFHALGVPTVDYGNNLRQMALEEGVANAFDSRVRAGLHPPVVLPRHRPVPLGGAVRRPRGHLQDRRQGQGTDPGRRPPAPLAGHGPRAHQLPGSAGTYLLGRPGPARQAGPGVQRDGPQRRAVGTDRHRPRPPGLRLRLQPEPRTEAMADGSDAVSDWPLLNALLNTASGATWVSLHHGGGVGMGFSQHAGMVIVCDGTEAAAKRIGRVLWNDPATGVMRHADAGYDIAIDCAKEKGLDLPGILG